MRILFLTPLGAIGGAERVLLDSIASLRQAERDLDIHVLVGSGGELVDALKGAGAKVTLLPMPRSLAALGDSALVASKGLLSRVSATTALVGAAARASEYALRLRRVIRHLQPDIVHSNGNKFHLLSRAIRRCPIVWHLHDFLGDRPMMRRLAHRAAGNLACAVAVSESVARDARRVLGAVPIEVIANAIDVERFSPGLADGGLLDRLAGLPPATNVVRVGLAATYARWKGQDMFLEAAARMSEKLAIRFFIIGGPIYQTSGSQFSVEELHRRIRDFGLSKRVGLIHFQNDMPAIYRALDLVVHASVRPEPFGLTIAEAMACGRPVIVSTAGGAAELFTHGRDAFGVTPGDVGQLADAIGLLAANANLRLQLGASARQTAQRRFDRSRLGPRLLDLYRRLMRA
jgi:glycosyltransferase involved in cell wall biosynthesis